MPLSSFGSSLGENGLVWGDPCYEVDMSDARASCQQRKSLANLALRVVGKSVGAGGSCCPLDIVAQDALTCIRMSLFEDFVRGGGFCEIFDGPDGIYITDIMGGVNSQLPRIQHCVPAQSYRDELNQVIVRSGDPVPSRRCGSTLQLVPDEAEFFSWKEVTTYGGSDTCQAGTFSEYGCWAYPAYESARFPEDLKAYETVSHWFVSVKFPTRDRRINIQCVSNATVTASLSYSADGDSSVFGPECVVDKPVKQCNPNPYDLGSQEASAFAAAAIVRDRWLVIAAVPSFRVYGKFTGGVPNLKDMVNYNAVECITNPSESFSLYSSTSSIYVTAAALAESKIEQDLDYEFLDFGREMLPKTYELSQGEVWIDITELNSDLLTYGVRFQPPPSANLSKKIQAFKKHTPGFEGSTEFFNPFYQHMSNQIINRFMAQAATVPFTMPSNDIQIKQVHGWLDSYKKGFINRQSDICSEYINTQTQLWGWSGSLFLADTNSLYAAVQVNIPGIQIHSVVVSADDIASTITLSATPVISVDIPGAVAGAGEYFSGTLDLLGEFQDNRSMFCSAAGIRTSLLEQLSEACRGPTLDINVPFLFPESNTGGGFSTCGSICYSVAHRLYSYINKSKSMGAYTYVCGPPTQTVPKVGTLYQGRTINSVNISYNDGSSFITTIECGPASIAASMAGQIASTKKTSIQVQGVVSGNSYGALYSVSVPVLGSINAYNMEKYPWPNGSRVNVTIYNYPG